MSGRWYSGAATLEEKKSKFILHPFAVKGYSGLAINPYQGCGHRCAYCYATYEWSPEFYDKIYAKSNAPEVLDRQLAAWKSATINPVMVASATDAYQPAELRYELTRKCVQVLQKYNVPYYVFTKSAIIERDLNLHSQYRHNCYIVWSITTCDEKIRRVIEPGTPPATRIFEAIKKFTAAGVCCGVNIDPIIPLVTDSEEHLDAVVRSCEQAGISFVSGAILRLRTDIWDRMKVSLQLLEIPNGANRYKQIYNFEEPLDSNYLEANKRYAEKIIILLDNATKSRGLARDFPDHIGQARIDRSHLGQITLHNFLA